MAINHKTRKPNVRIILDKDGFNCLIQGLENNAANKYANEQTIDGADRITNKIRQYSRLFVDEENRECAEIRFFETEASELIWQFVFASSAEEPGDDFYAELKEKRAENENRP